MDLNQIRSFLAVSQTLNFTNAAKQNGVPQSTISRQINDLEKQLNVRLFYRTKRDVQLTEEGRTFLPYAIEIIEASQKGAAAVRQLHEGAEGRLSIATIDTSGVFLSDCLRAFGKAYPEVVVDITYVSCGDALLDEGRDPYDFHFTHEDLLPDNEVFDTLATHADQLCVVHHRDRRVSLDNLQNERFILVSENESPILYMQAMDYFRPRRFAPTIWHESDSVRAVLLSVSADLGVTILPGSQACESMRDKLCAIPLDMEIAYGVAWKKSLLNPAAQLFLDVIRQHIQV